ncbi:MAG TPA: CoA pyrophosphatase [Nitrosopumilaceae archaeon]|nr:CoA pyrophosphatase [Nitrosopumilaceae archaeon]
MDPQKLKNTLSNEIVPDAKENGKKKLAAVLILIHGSEHKMIMTERPKTMNLHPGEISFPGGTWKEDDYDLLETAMRETREEIGLDVLRQQIIGQLKPVTTLNSGFTITPFVSITSEIPKLKPNSEIEKILHIPMFPLFKTIEKDRDPTHSSIQEMYTFRYQDYLIWGASARMIKQIMMLLSENGML